MRYSLTFILAVLGMVSVSLTGCGSVPQPFRPDIEDKAANPSLISDLNTGVFVLPLEGPTIWVGWAMAEAMATALRERSVAASTWSSNRASLFLASWGEGRPLSDGRIELLLSWTLSDGAGRVLGERKQKTVPPPEFWHSPSKEMFLEIAKKSAGRIARWVMPRTRDRARIALPNIRILPLDDAPGDAKISLVQAVSYYLKRRRVKVVTSLEAADLTVGVQITVSTLTDQRETVRITWTVLDDENKIIGTVDQENSVESGRLNKPWREIAGAVGEGAAEGIAGLAKEFAQSRVKSGNSP
ncbi:MAG: hypothetical protein HOL85_22835 [Rhodospirillaceae bacterium]|nr:hypothetical protein [Rhodospirillaceae bacterium]MBT6137164.1 hypothetical protein [Rhodospirillaceae bacterium]